MYKLSSYILGGGLVFSSDIKDFDSHNQRLIEISRFDALKRSYSNNLNRGFFIWSFSNFEVCVTIFCNAVLSDEKIEHLLNHSLNEITAILKNIPIDEKILLNLNKNLRKSHLTHVPLIRKIDMLLKACGNQYFGDKNDDREFLVFLSRFRNTVHSNWVYFGKDYEYFLFNGAHFIFRNGMQTVWSNPYNDDGTRIFIDIFDCVKEIWRKLISNISHDGLIEFYQGDID
jgi:hypothetical protein